MRVLYTFAVSLLFFLPAGCSKDLLKSYDDRIIGTWQIIDIDRFGFSGSDNLPFAENGVFTFLENGQATYTYAGFTHTGSWDIIRKDVYDDNPKRSLQISVIDFNSQVVLSDFFNDMRFTSTNRFNAFIYYGSRTYVYRFKRQ
jgi:hypothetical protein